MSVSPHPSTTAHPVKIVQIVKSLQLTFPQSLLVKIVKVVKIIPAVTLTSSTRQVKIEKLVKSCELTSYQLESDTT